MQLISAAQLTEHYNCLRAKIKKIKTGYKTNDFSVHVLTGLKLLKIKR